MSIYVHYKGGVFLPSDGRSKLILKEVYLIGLNNKHLYKIFTNTKYPRYLSSSQDQGLILSKWKLVEVWFN